MGRYYHGDIEGKFWFAMMDSDVASIFGDYGEDMFYCEERGCEVRASEIENLTQKEKDSLCNSPSYIYYSYYYDNSNGVEDTNFVIEVLQDKIKEVQKLLGGYVKLIDKKLEVEQSKNGYSIADKILSTEQYIQKLEILSKLVEARKLREATVDRYEDMLFCISNFLYLQNNQYIKPITEVAMGSRIFSKLLEIGRCEFEAEI